MKTTLLTLLSLVAVALGLAQSRSHAQDITPPFLVAVGSADGVHIDVCFSETMQTDQLGNPFNYSVTDSSGQIGPVAVAIHSGNRAVVLTLLSPVSGFFSVETELLSDLAGNFLATGSSATGEVGALPLALADIGGPAPSGTVFSCDETELIVRAGGDRKSVV